MTALWKNFAEAAPEEATATINATLYVPRDPASIPRRQWLLGRHLVRQFGAATIAAPGVGKTNYKLVQAISLVTQRDLIGMVPQERCRVWYWNGEDPLVEIERRIAAICLHYGITPAELGDRLFIDTGRETKIVIARQSRDGAIISEPVVASLISTIEANAIDVVIIDPFISCHRVTESDNNAIEVVAKEWTEIADRTNTAIDLVHHSKKTYGAEVTAEDSRGASALIAAVRSAEVLNKMTKEAGQKLGLSNYREYFKVEDGKPSLTKPAEEEDWFQMISVPLGNGEPNALLETGDDVGVVTKWQLPNHTANISGADFDKVAAVIRGDRWRENPQATKWVGHAIARAMELNVKKLSDKAKVRAALGMWLAAGTLRVVEATDDKRNVRKFVEVADHVDD